MSAVAKKKTPAKRKLSLAWPPGPDYFASQSKASATDALARLERVQLGLNRIYSAYVTEILAYEGHKVTESGDVTSDELAPDFAGATRELHELREQLKEIIGNSTSQMEIAE